VRAAARVLGVWLAVLGPLWTACVSWAGVRGPEAAARAAALGGSFVAVADDASAPLFNPAGAAAVDGITAAFTRSAFFSGLVDPLVFEDAAHLAAELGRGGVALGVTTLADGESVYRETTVSAGYAHRLRRGIRVGGQVKWLHAGLDAANPDVADNDYLAGATSRSAWTGDAGLLVSPLDGLTLGASVQNVRRADLTFGRSTASDADRTPTLGRIGAAFRLRAVAAAVEQAALEDLLARSLVTAEVVSGDGARFGAGAEIGVAGSLTVRVGYRTVSGGAAAATAGASLNATLGGVLTHLDFAADVLSGDLKDNLTQRVSLRASF
jgi:hypothetical protein